MSSTPTPPERPPFGDLDGEIIEGLAIRISGTGGLTELPDDGDELVLLATVTVGPGVKIKRDDAGRLLREHSAKVTRLAIAPEGTDLADDATSYLEGYAAALDRLRGIDRLDFDTGEDLSPFEVAGEPIEEEDGNDD